MKLSTKGRYGLRLMLDLAGEFGKGPVALNDIARRQSVSESYLLHLIPPLKKAGLVVAVRGAQGGYALARTPGRINLYEIISSEEGSLCLVKCGDNPASCLKSGDCVARDVWAEASRRVVRTLESFTLASMLRLQRKARKGGKTALGSPGPVDTQVKPAFKKFSNKEGTHGR